MHVTFGPTSTFETPAVISLPMATHASPELSTELRIVTLFVGGKAAPCVPLLMAIASSPVVSATRSITTPSQPSGSMPSPFGTAFVTSMSWM